ncbi:MAG: diguanylate cyclase [Chromatiales bacterium]|nr:diguanylate cyclase [Chromatiales bacterium]
MTLKQKASTVFIGLLLFVSAVQYTLTWALIMPEFDAIEKNEIWKNNHRLQQALKQELTHLDNLTLDWASWNDTVEFISTRSTDYIESNLADESLLENLNIHHMQFIDTSGKTLWIRSIDLNGDASQLKSVSADSVTLTNKLLPAPKEPEEESQSVSGIVINNGNIMAISSRHILHSNNHGPSYGYLIFGRYLQENTLKDLTQLNLSFKDTRKLNNTDVEPSDSDPLISFLTDNQQIITRMIIEDIYGSHAFTIEIAYQRHITQEGKNVINLSALSAIAVGVATIALIIFLINNNILTPLSTILQQIQNISTSLNYNKRVIYSNRDEFGQLSTSINTLLDTIQSKTDSLNDLNDELLRLSLHDPLTGIANRRMFDQEFAKEWNRHRRDKSSLSVIMCDIDYFKKYNDTYGHQQGDDCIIQVANILKSSLNRASDIVARYGGEEFVILMIDANIQDGKQLAEKILHNLSTANIEHKGSSISEHITMSFGVASLVPDASGSTDILLRHADKALYSAKQNGRNQICLYS